MPPPPLPFFSPSQHSIYCLQMHAWLSAGADSLSHYNCWLIKSPWQLAASTCILFQSAGTPQGKALSHSARKSWVWRGEEQPAALERNCWRIAHRSLLDLTHSDAVELKRDFCNVTVSPQIRPSGKIPKTVTVPVGCRIS